MTWLPSTAIYVTCETVNALCMCIYDLWRSSNKQSKTNMSSLSVFVSYCLCVCIVCYWVVDELHHFTQFTHEYLLLVVKNNRKKSYIVNKRIIHFIQVLITLNPKIWSVWVPPKKGSAACWQTDRWEIGRHPFWSRGLISSI